MSATALTIASLLPVIVQGGMGAYQLMKGNRMSRKDVPDYEIAPALRKMIGIQRSEMNKDMAGYDTMVGQIGTTTANLTDQMSQFGMLDPNILNKIYQNESQMLGNLGVQNLQHQDREREKYLNMLGMLAGEENAKQKWEVQDPYVQQMATASALQGSGLQNIYGSLGSLADKFMMKQMYPATPTTPKTGAVTPEIAQSLGLSNTPLGGAMGISSAGGGAVTPIGTQVPALNYRFNPTMPMSKSMYNIGLGNTSLSNTMGVNSIPMNIFNSKPTDFEYDFNIESLIPQISKKVLDEVPRLPLTPLAPSTPAINMGNSYTPQAYNPSTNMANWIINYITKSVKNPYSAF